MSHDGTFYQPVNRKERRAAYGKRQAAPRRTFSASEYVREDWLPEDLIEMLESRARGYNGILRAVLCTAAAMLRDAMSEDLLQEAQHEARVQNELAEEVGA